jgi:hypothetical protein
LAGTVSCAFITVPQVEQWDPAVSPAVVQVAATAASVTSVLAAKVAGQIDDFTRAKLTPGFLRQYTPASRRTEAKFKVNAATIPIEVKAGNR